MDHNRAKQVDVANKFKKAIINNMLTSFFDEIRHLSELQAIFLQRPTEPKLLNIANILDVNGWRYTTSANTSVTRQCCCASRQCCCASRQCAVPSGKAAMSVIHAILLPRMTDKLCFLSSQVRPKRYYFFRLALLTWNAASSP